MIREILIITTIALFITGCSSTPSCLNIVPPEVNLTGEKTVIERQIVGDYEELEEDAWTISSVKRPSTGTTPGGKNAGDPEIIKSMRIMESLLESISIFKKEGAIGEANTGYLEYMKTARIDSNKNLKRQVLSLIKTENSSRKTIFLRTTMTSGKYDNVKASEFGKEYAKEQRALAKKGEWIQTASGNWVRK